VVAPPEHDRGRHHDRDQQAAEGGAGALHHAHRHRLRHATRDRGRLRPASGTGQAQPDLRAAHAQLHHVAVAQHGLAHLLAAQERAAGGLVVHQQHVAAPAQDLRVTRLRARDRHRGLGGRADGGGQLAQAVDVSATRAREMDEADAAGGVRIGLGREHYGAISFEPM
jgi:hypothetical protein